VVLVLTVNDWLPPDGEKLRPVGDRLRYGGGSCPTLTDALSPPPVTVTEPVRLDEVVLAPQVTVTVFPDREILDTQPE